MLKNKYYYTIKPDQTIKPNRMVIGNESFKIQWCHWGYHIKKYFVVVNNFNDNILKEIILDRTYHPNGLGEITGKADIRNPAKYVKMCVSNRFINKFKFINEQNPIRKKGQKIITSKEIEMFHLSIWVMDNPHHYPRKEYVKIPGYKGII